MKKMMSMALLAVLITLSACAQKLKKAEVPVAIKTNFANQYPGASAKWEKENGGFEAEFKMEGKTMSALFDANGVMTETEMEIKVADLPASVLAYVKAHYNGKKIKEGAKITQADGTVNYEAEVDGKDVMFDAAGNFLKEVKD